MVAVLTLLLILIVNIALTRIATVALVHTGLGRETARFQACSAFTGVGFTTSEAEGIVSHPVRRRIVLMFQKYEVVNNSAREGARFATANPNVTTAEVQTRVLNYIQGSGLVTAAGNPVIVVTPTTWSVGPGTWQARQVDVFYFHDYTFLGPMADWFGGSFTSASLNGRATMRIESNVTGLP